MVVGITLFRDGKFMEKSGAGGGRTRLQNSQFRGDQAGIRLAGILILIFFPIPNHRSCNKVRWFFFFRRQSIQSVEASKIQRCPAGWPQI
jgi:hypothetical protein